MRKRLTAVLLAVILVFVLCPATALAAPAKVYPTFQNPQKQAFIEADTLHYRVMLLKTNGEFWGHDTWYNTSERLMENAVAFCYNAYHRNAYVLQKNGMLWELDFAESGIDVTSKSCIDTGVKRIYIDTGAKRIYDGIYLKQNGDLYYIDYGYYSKKLKLHAQNVICFDINKNYITYITEDHVLHYALYTSYTEFVNAELSGFSDLYPVCLRGKSSGTYFALSDQGELYSWGDNRCGAVGCGPVYDYHTQGCFVPFDDVSEPGLVGLSVYVSKPTKILDDTVSIYDSGSGIYAKTADGQLWQWGDAPQGARAPHDKEENAYYPGRTQMPDGYYCIPRPYSGVEPAFGRADDPDIPRTYIEEDGVLSFKGGREERQRTSFTWNDILKGDGSVDTYIGGSSGSALFDDVSENAYYYAPVKWAVESGVTTGTGARTFSPEQRCTRAQIIAFLWRAAGSPEPSGSSSPFADVTTGAYYYKAALWAYENDILPDGKFYPDETCTRSMAVDFMWQAAGCPTASDSAFEDVPSDAGYAQAVAWAVEKKITAGTSETAFSPDQACTRAQIVTFLYRYAAP